LTYIPNIQFAPFYIADAEGYWAGPATVTLRHHGASEGLFTALTTGDEEFVVAGGDEILQARAQGIDTVAVASYYAQHPARLIVPADSPIRAVGDLAGHSVGIPGRYGETWFALLIALRQAGLTEADVTITEIGFTQQAALVSGDVDAVMGFANSDVPAFAAADVAVRAIDPAVPLVSICLATSQAYAQAHPEVVDRVVAGMKAGMRAALDDPEAALATAADYIPSFRGEAVDTARQVLPATTALFVGADGQISPPLDPAQWQAMAQAMAQVGLIPEGTDPTTAYLLAD
jgi:NitT/TauT family transport system substrate-binding protein